jgi:tagatose 6-phosphate kinase
VIVTITLNPALHVRYDAPALELGRPNQVSRARYRAGGRGLAVARLVRTFGHDVVAAGLAGGSSGDQVRAELARAGVATQFTRIGAETRRTIEIAPGGAGRVTCLEEPAPYITTEELGRLAADYRALLEGAEAVVLCGNLPAGLPDETYGSLTRYAGEAGVPVVLNAGGSALRHGVARGPALVLPEDETDSARPAGIRYHDSQVQAAGEDAAAQRADGPASAVVHRTDGGVRVLTPDGTWTASVAPAAGVPAEPGSVTRDLATAQRDALVAGFVPGIALGWSWPDMLRHALALAASVSAHGEVDLAAYEMLLPGVRIAGPHGD